MNILVRYKIDGIIKSADVSGNEDFTLDIREDGDRTRISIAVHKPLELVSAEIEESVQVSKGSHMFLNGYQSWTETREYDMSERVHNMNRLSKRVKDRFHFEAYGDPWFYEYDRNILHGFTYLYIKDAGGEADLIGSLNEENAYLIIAYNKQTKRIRLKSDCEFKCVDGSFVLFDYVRLHGRTGDVLKKYFDLFGACSAPPIRGYTSWYLYYQDINEEKMNRALQGIDSDNYDLFQIDDGYETYVGDWMDIDDKKFPDGLEKTVRSIHDKKLKAGIWLAPFVCELKSRTYSEHPDWILKKNGKDVFAGSNWSGDVALDIRKEEVRDYIRSCLEYYIGLGFDFFKLDFLYAAALCADGDVPADRDIMPSEGSQDSYVGSNNENALQPRTLKTRAEIMHFAMVWLRGILKDKLILGCGVPLSSAFGLVDYCRIGPDVSLRFDDVFYMKYMHRERISTKVTLLNTIYRSILDGHVFRCDPDVYLLRDDNIRLSKEQRRALVTLNHLCGSVYMTSDNVQDYDEEKKAVLAQAQKLASAVITDISRDDHVITVNYVLDGVGGQIRYDSKRGVLI